MSRPRSAISVTGLRKAYGGRPVLDGIDLDVAEREVVAIDSLAARLR